MLKIKSFQFNPVQENTYLLYNGFNECAIIDPGCYFAEEEDELAGFISAQGLKPVLLLNTHCHLDHVFGNKFVAEKYGLKLAIHPGEKPMLDRAPESGLMFNLPFDSYYGEIEELHPGQEIKLGDDKLKILFVPGHSPAGIAFYNEEGSFVISGDALFYHSIGRTDLPGGDLDTLLGSIRQELFALPAHTRVYSGHGPETTIGEEKMNNPFLK